MAPYTQHGLPFSGPETSKDAADSVAPVSGRLRRIVLSLIGTARDGLTCDEVEHLTGLPHQTVSARIRELADGGSIVDSLSRRSTRSGRKAIVWVRAQ